MFNKTTVAVLVALATVKGVTAQADGKLTTALERTQWCQTGHPDSKLPCDRESQINVAAITGAGMNTGNKTDRQSREKLIPYYHARRDTLDEWKKNNECCRQCKLANKVLTVEQEQYWKRVSDDTDSWLDDMAAFEKNLTATSPDIAWEHSMKLQTGQPGSTLANLTTAQVPLEQYCPALAADAASSPAQPPPAIDGSAGSQTPVTAVVPQPPTCYLVQAEASTGFNVSSAKFRMNVTANAQVKMAQEVCAPTYYISRLVGGELQSGYVLEPARLVAGRGNIPIEAGLEQYVPADCGRCDRSAPPVSPEALAKQSYAAEVLKQVQQTDISAEANVNSRVTGNFVFTTTTPRVKQSSVKTPAGPAAQGSAPQAPNGPAAEDSTGQLSSPNGSVSGSGVKSSTEAKTDKTLRQEKNDYCQ